MTWNLYNFWKAHFKLKFPPMNPYALLTHANEASKLWNEIFGHLNYKYLSDLSEKEMVIGLPQDKIFQRSLPRLYPRKTPRAQI